MFFFPLFYTYVESEKVVICVLNCKNLECTKYKEKVVENLLRTQVLLNLTKNLNTETLRLRDFSFFLSSMNENIKKTQFFL